MKAVHVIAWILLVIGGLNWLLVGINADWNVVGMLPETVARIIYVLVGLSAIVSIFTHKRDCKCCDAAAPSQPM
jgi:uncharacterized membrane protein YuzA (DUF378 family)